MCRREGHSSCRLLLPMAGLLVAVLVGQLPAANAQSTGDGFSNCAANIYQCFSSTIQVPSSQLQPSMCSSNSSCDTNAAAACPATFALAGQELAAASYQLYRLNCDQKYCFNPLQLCVGNPFLSAYTSNDFGAYCTSFSSAAANCQTPNCGNPDAVSAWKADLATLCVTGGQCYQAAVTCVSYAYFDPQVQDLSVICLNSSSTAPCIANVLSSSVCNGVASSIVTAVNNLLQAYSTKCDINHVCNQTLATCLSPVVSTNIISSQFASSVCSNLAGVQTCLNANTACQGHFTDFITQLQQYCAPQLCAAGVQFCYDAFAFNTSLLQTGTVADYLKSWCNAATTIQTCLANHNTLCNVIGYDFQATVGTSLDSLCTLGNSPDAAGVGCYWTALNCLYANGIVQYDSPTEFWVPQTTDYCASVSYNTTSTCLSDARAQCTGASAAAYQQAIDNVNYAFTTSCTPSCSPAGRQTCQDALTYYLSQMLNGSTNLCSMLSQPHTCYGMQIKGCTSLTGPIKASNVAIINSLFVALSQICSSLTPPNGTNTCIDGVVQCLVTFFGEITGNTDFNTQNAICQNWNSTKTCIATAQSTCSDSLVTAVNSIVHAVDSVLASLKPCNAATTCNLQVSISCQTDLATQIQIVNDYEVPIDFKGNKRNVFCRKDLDGSAAISSGFQDDGDDLSAPLVCSYPKFYWGSLCVNLNATQSCVANSTLNCTGAIQLEQQSSLQSTASFYISSCSGKYQCNYDATELAVIDLVQFGLQSQFKNVRNQKDNFCFWFSDISISIWSSASQCTPFVSQYFWQFVEAYLEIVADGCKPRQIICTKKKCPPPRTSWHAPLPPDCSMTSIQAVFLDFFNAVWMQSISVTPDTNAIASALADLQAQIQLIQAGDANYAGKSCQWAADFISSIIVNFQIEIDIIISPPTCFILDAYDCFAGLQKFVTKRSLSGAGHHGKKNRDLFCRAATNTFTCISTATVGCTASQQQAVFDLYYQLQDFVGYPCRDRCTSNPCQNDGMCSTRVAGSDTVTPPARCSCNPGYFGDNCETTTCNYADLLNCVNPVVNILMSDDFSGLETALINAETCLNKLDGNCQYDFSFEIILDIYVRLNTTLAVTSSGCSGSAIRTCLRPPNVPKPIKLFDPKTKFLSKDVCSKWSVVLSCLQTAGCSSSQIDSLSDYFSAGCVQPPPSACPVKHVADKVNRCGHKFNRVKYGKPQPKRKVPNPEKRLGRCRKKYTPENVPPPNDNQLDDNGLNLNLDVCGDLGDSWSDANHTTGPCGPRWADKVEKHLVQQSVRYIGNGQCANPCDTDQCAYGSTCVPNVNPPVGYTCVCLPGWSGRYCDVAPTPTCQTKDCPQQLLALLNDIVSGNSTSTACSQLPAISSCLSTDLYPCGDNYAADATLMIQFINFITSTICATPPTGTCEINFLSVCMKKMLTNLYVNVDGGDNECIYRQSTAFCLTSVQVVCRASDGTFGDVLSALLASAISQYVTSCQPSDCDVSKVIDCLTPLQYATGFQLIPSNSDTCSTGAAATSCVRQATSNCPPWLTQQVNDLLNSLINQSNSAQPPPSSGSGSGSGSDDVCSTTPCQNGGVCSPDSFSPNRFSCKCEAGFVGDFCQFVGCNPSNISVSDCLSLLLPVFNVPWTNDCPTVDCDLLQSARDCLSAYSCTTSFQADQLVNVVNLINTRLCGPSAPSCTGPQPATCPVSQVRLCFLQYSNVAFIHQVSSESKALEFGMPFPSLGGDKSSVACANAYATNASCNSDFKNVLTALLNSIDTTFAPNTCYLKGVDAFQGYVEATVPYLQAHPNLPNVVKQALCSNMYNLLIALDTVINLCETVSDPSAQDPDTPTIRATYNTAYDNYTSVCTLQGCSPNPCQNGGLCVSQPGGGFTCSCPSGITGDTCQNGQPSCNYYDALGCFQQLRTTVDSCGSVSNNETLCQAIVQTRDCIATNTANCPDDTVVTLYTELNSVQSQLSLSCYSPCDTRVCGYTSDCSVGSGNNGNSYTCSCAFGYTGPDCLTETCDPSAISKCVVDAFAQIIAGTFCPNGLNTTVSCINAYTSCSEAYRSTAIVIVTQFDSLLCHTPTCSLATVKSQCLSLLPSSTQIWDAVRKSIAPNYCSPSIVSNVLTCLVNLASCTVSGTFTATVKYLCPSDPLPSIPYNCSLAAITQGLTDLQSSLDQAKKKQSRAQQTSSSSSSASNSSSSDSCTSPSPTRSVTVNFYKSGMLCIDGTVQTLNNANSWTKSDTVPLPDGLKVIGVRSSRTPCKKAGMIVAATNDYFVSDTKWKCKACSDSDTDFCAADFDDSLWSPAVIVKSFSESGRKVDGLDPSTKANIIWTDTKNGIDKVVCCRLKAITPLVLSLYSPCENYQVYVDGALQQKPVIADSAGTYNLAPTASLISVDLGVDCGCGCGFIASVTGDLVVSDSSWKCSEQLSDGWLSTPQPGWPNAVQETPVDPSESYGVSLNAFWISTGGQSGNRFGCQKQFSQPAPYPVQTANKQCDSRPVIPDDGTNPCWYVQSSYSSVEAIISQCDSTWMTTYSSLLATLLANYTVTTTCSNQCANNPCLNRGTCQPTEYSFKCKCQPGYSGVLCEKGGGCSLQRSQDCLTRLLVLTDAIIANATVLSQPDTLTSLNSLLLCLSVNQQPCSPQDSYVYEVIVVYIEYLINLTTSSTPTVGCDYTEFITCTVQLTSNIYLSSTALDISLQSMLQCLITISTKCGPVSPPIDGVIWITWLTIEVNFPDSHCSFSGALSCNGQIKSALLAKPNDRSAVCLYYNASVSCVADAVSNCFFSTIKDRITLAASIDIQGASLLCINACEGYPCFNGGICTQVGSIPSCTCATGWAGTNCDQPSGCQLDALQSCLESGFAQIAIALRDPCSPIDCSSPTGPVGRLLLCLQANVAHCDAATIARINLLKAALTLLTSIPRVCAPSPPPNCVPVTPPLPCDWQTVEQQIVTMVQTAFSQLSAFPGPDLNVLCTVTNQTKNVLSDPACKVPGLQTILDGVNSFINTLIGTTCSPVCPASGSLPQVASCLTTLKQLVDSVLNVTVLSLTAQGDFCGEVWASGSCVQSALDFCSDPSVETQYANYTTSVSIICPLPCQFDLCEPGSICVPDPTSSFGFQCVCPPDSSDTNCQIQPSCDLSQADVCLKPVKDLMTVGGNSSPTKTQFCDALTAATDCLNTLMDTCTDPVFGAVFDGLFKTLNAFQKSFRFVCITPCDSNPCNNGAACIVNDTMSTPYYCVCPPNFDGPTCQHQLCSEDDIGVCFSWVLKAFFKSPDQVCQAVASLHACLEATTVSCPQSVQSIYFSIEANLTASFSLACNNTPPHYFGCSLSALASCSSADLLTFLTGSGNSLTALQLTTVCSEFNAFAACAVTISPDCLAVVEAVGGVLSLVCTEPPNPTCNLQVAISALFEFSSYALTAQLSWNRGDRYGGLSRDEYMSEKQKTAKLDRWIPKAVSYSLDDGPLYACWHLESLRATITVSVSGCLIASIAENITVALTAYEAQYLSGGACSYPCDGDPCIAGGSCAVQGLGFTCTCPPGLDGSFCDQGASCDYQAAYGQLDVFAGLLNGGTLALSQFITIGGPVSWQILLQYFDQSLLACPDIGDQSTSISIFISIFEYFFTVPIDCDAEGAFTCASAFLVALQPPLGSSSPPDASQLCLLFQTLSTCALNVRITCQLPAIDFSNPPAVLPISVQLAQQAFIATEAVCVLSGCDISVVQQGLSTLTDAIATNGPDVCTIVYAQKELVLAAIVSCPSFVAVDVKASLDAALLLVKCITPCSTTPCLNNGTCNELSSTSYTCHCPSEFTGEHCQTDVGCDVSAVSECAAGSLQQIVYAFMDPCNGAIDCSVIDDFAVCMKNKTVNCDSFTRGFFESAISALESIRYICDATRTSPVGCGSSDCTQSSQTLRALLLDFLTNFFDQLSQPQGPNFDLVCSSWQTISVQLTTKCTLGDFRLTVSSTASWIQNVTSSMCTMPICYAPSALGCLTYLNDYLAQIEAQPGVLQSDLDTFCRAAEDSYECVIGNLAGCNASDSTRAEVLLQWNETYSAIVSQQLCTLPCVSQPCLNNGTCVQTSATAFVCNCTSNYAGPLCQYAALYPYDNSTGLLCQGNAYSSSLSFDIILSLPIQLFCQSFTNIFVSQSGYVTLDSDTPILNFLKLCPSTRNIIAPLFAWQDCSCAGSSVSYNYYSTVSASPLSDLGASIIDRATAQVQQYSSDLTFTATTVVVITWSNIFPYPCNYYMTQYGLTTGSTYQLVLIADLLRTYVLYNYNSLNVGPLIPAVHMGHSINGHCTASWNPTSLSSPSILSITPPVTNLKGQWFFEMFDSSVTCPPPPPELVCLGYVQSTIDLTQYNLQPCPCNGRLAASDPRFRFSYVDWFRYCFSYNIPVEATSGLTFTQTCCYNPANAALYTSPPYGGFPTVSGGSVTDSQIYTACCISSNTYCNVFMSLRPIDKCNKYTGPAQALIWGDPHFYTVDGLSYTFNGIGDYVMTKTRSSSYVFQARTAQFADLTGQLFNASGFVAFAAQEFSSKIEVYMNAGRDGLVVYYNGLLYGQNSLIVPAIFISQTSTAVNVTFPSGWTLNIGLAFRFLSVVQTLPLVAWNNTQGLLGLYNGITSDDLMAPDGTVLPTTSSLSTIHQNLGLLWQVQASESLFTSNGARVTADPGFSPVFDNPCSSPADDTAAKTLCGTSWNCYYDYCVTRSSQIASSTLAFETAYNNSRKTLMSMAPTLSIVELQSYFNLRGVWLLNATVNQPVRLTLQAVSTVQGVTVAIHMIGNITAQPTAKFDAAAGIFTWTPTSLSPVDVSFVAIDSNGGVSPQLQVTVRLCGGCNGHGNCDYTRYQHIGFGINFQLTNCTCDIGWTNNTGGECASQYNACVLNPCGVDSPTVCSPFTPEQQQATKQAYSCSSCQTGYAPPLCLDINECAQTPPICNQLCNNTQGSYVCSCRSGYNLINPTTCVDIDECSLQTLVALCGQSCVNTDGSYHCACQTGYRLTSDNVNCVDIDECAEKTALCNQDCVNTRGSYNCVCHSGYRLVNPYKCVALPLEIVLRFRLSVTWDDSYLDQRSAFFIRLKNTLEPKLLKIIRRAVSVLLLRCSKSSVLAEVQVGFNDTVTPAVTDEVSIDIGNALNAGGWSFVAPDGTVFPVMETPAIIVDNSTVNTSYNPCTGYTLCQNGGTCQSQSVNGVFSAPNCTCTGSYTGQYCEQNIAPTTTATQQPPSANVLAIVVGVVVPVVVVLLVLIGFLVYKSSVKNKSNYWSNMGQSPHESLGLEGKRSLRMHRFWPFRPST